MAKTNTLYLLIALIFAAAFLLAAIHPSDNIIGILCAGGITLFIWRIIRGDD